MAKELGDMIRDARERKSLSLRSTAKRARISAALLSLIERSMHTPSNELIVVLARILDGDDVNWCGIAGTITPSAEKAMARLSAEDPHLFRKMINKIG